MPIYEYRCTACSTLTDIRHGFDEVNTDVCGICGGPLARSFNVSGIVFKGAGFYKTDSRGGDSESKPTPTAAPTPTPAPAPAPSSDSKSAA